MRFYSYNWLHTRTGTSGTKSETFTDRESFLSFLNNCNRSLPGVWVYWEA